MDESPWLSKQELKSADQKLEQAKAEAVRAAQKALDDMKRMGVIEGKIESIARTLESYQTELHILSSELNGEATFDREFGLSSEPRFYREEKATIGGACKTERPFARAPNLATSTGAYLLGLMPPELVAKLGIDIPTVRRDPHYFLPTTDGRSLLFGCGMRRLLYCRGGRPAWT